MKIQSGTTKRGSGAFSIERGVGVCPKTENWGIGGLQSGSDAMKAISFWGLCRVTILHYVDRIAINLHRTIATANTEIFPLALRARLRRKRLARTKSARRVLRARAKVKAEAAVKPLAGVGVNADD